MSDPSVTDPVAEAVKHAGSGGGGNVVSGLSLTPGAHHLLCGTWAAADGIRRQYTDGVADTVSTSQATVCGGASGSVRSTVLALVALGFFSCGPTRAPLCVTKCGMHLMGDRYGNMPPEARSESQQWASLWSDEEYFSCEQFQWTEDVALREFGAVTDPSFKDVCAAIHNVPVYVQHEPNWVDEWGRHIGGMTDCRFTTIPIIYVGNAHPLRGSLVHEMAHAIQRCSPRKPIDPSRDADHANWTRDGIGQAIAGCWDVYDSAMYLKSKTDGGP